MIRATFIYPHSNEIGTILQWDKSNAHLTPEHLKTIKQHGFVEMEYSNIANCSIEINGKLVALYSFCIWHEIGEIHTALTDERTGKYTINKYLIERVM